MTNSELLSLIRGLQKKVQSLCCQVKNSAIPNTVEIHDYGTIFDIDTSSSVVTYAITGSGTGTTTANVDNSAFSVGDVFFISDVDNKAVLNNIVIDFGAGVTASYNGATAQTATSAINGETIMFQKITSALWKAI